MIINPGNVSEDVDGSRSVSPTVTTTYTLTATGAEGAQPRTATATVTVTVKKRPKSPVIESFTATPETIYNTNDSSTLRWDTTHAESVIINPGNVSEDVDGSRSVSPTVTTTYTLTATGAEGAQPRTATATVTVTVKKRPKSPVIESFTATPETIYNTNDSSTLRWDTTHAESVIINPGNVSEDVDGSRSVSPDGDDHLYIDSHGGGRSTA